MVLPYMFSFIKKIFSIGRSSTISNSHSQKRNNHEPNYSALHDEDDFDWKVQQQSIEQHQSSVDQHERDRQQFEQQNQMSHDEHQLKSMNNPYMNPGQDIVVDEHYHDIDLGFSNVQHDFDNSFHDNNDHDMNHSFDGGGHEDHF